MQKEVYSKEGQEEIIMATTEQTNASIEQIPYVALEALGKIFAEGEKKYGVGNWKDNATPEYRIERLRHAIRHLMLFANEDTSEKHLAKVLWFCATELYHESVTKPLRQFSLPEKYPHAKKFQEVKHAIHWVDLPESSYYTGDTLNAYLNPTKENLDKVFNCGVLANNVELKDGMVIKAGTPLQLRTSMSGTSMDLPSTYLDRDSERVQGKSSSESELEILRDVIENKNKELESLRKEIVHMKDTFMQQDHCHRQRGEKNLELNNQNQALKSELDKLRKAYKALQSNLEEVRKAYGEVITESNRKNSELCKELEALKSQNSNNEWHEKFLNLQKHYNVELNRRSEYFSTLEENKRLKENIELSEQRYKLMTEEAIKRGKEIDSLHDKVRDLSCTVNVKTTQNDSCQVRIKHLENQYFKLQREYEDLNKRFFQSSDGSNLHRLEEEVKLATTRKEFAEKEANAYTSKLNEMNRKYDVLNDKFKTLYGNFLTIQRILIDNAARANG